MMLLLVLTWNALTLILFHCLYLHFVVSMPPPKTDEEIKSYIEDPYFHGYNFSTYERVAPIMLQGAVLQHDKKRLNWWIFNHQKEMLHNISYYVRNSMMINSQSKWELIPTPKRTRTITNDVIFFWISTHYYHFMFESLPQIYSLYIHGVFRDYPQATILSGWKRVDKGISLKMLQFLGLDQLILGSKSQHEKDATSPTRNIIPFTHELRVIIPDSYRLITPPKVGHFTNSHPYLLSGIRSLFPISKDPHRIIYVTRGNDRRKLLDEAHLLQRLRQYLPQLEVIYPGNYSIQQQYEAFSNASVVIGPHGNAFTNLIFCPSQVVVIEFRGKGSSTYLHQARKLQLNLSNFISFETNRVNPNSIQSDLFFTNFTKTWIEIQQFLEARQKIYF